MELITTVELTEEDVNTIITSYIENLHKGYKVKNIDYRTAVRGDYDRGNAEEYVDSVVIDLKKT